VAKEAAEVATKVKGSWSNGIAEEHVAWVPLVSGLREYAETLEAGGAPKPVGVRTLPSGQHILDVFPTGCVASPNRKYTYCRMIAAGIDAMAACPECKISNDLRLHAIV